MLFIYKIKFADEANKSRVSYWSFPLVLCFKSSQGKKKIFKGLQTNQGLNTLFATPLLLFIWSKGHFGFCPDTVKHQVKHVEKKQVII